MIGNEKGEGGESSIIDQKITYYRRDAERKISYRKDLAGSAGLESPTATSKS